MNTKKLLYALVMLFAITGSSMAQQPFGGCWHPDDVKDWNPANDPEAKFNRSTVALQPRFQDETVMANANQHYDGQVAACLTMHPMCSRCPSQGADNFVGYNPTYWQYMDLLIWWAGSAGEGIIIPPSAPVTDAAHMSGVKSLGQVFFPPSTFGGQHVWVTQMLTKEGDTFPYAQKLYEIAKYYGFDGWFINEETAIGYTSAWGEWISYFYQLAEADGLPMEIQWYDCSTSIGSKLDMLKQDGASFFANYGSPSASNIASQMGALTGAGLSKQQAFESIYFGIKCAQGGIGGNGSYIKNCFPTDEHKGSIDLFCPEYSIWKQVVESILGTDDAMGDVAYAKMDQVFKNESRFWVNVAGDPSNVSGRSGSTNPGFANAIAERSTIQTLPFVTTFSAGLGKARYVNGEVRGTHDWYHRGMQTIMPTWRWWIADNTDNLSIDMNWDDAFNMGTSLKVTGKLSANADHLTRLYKTKLAISAGDKLELTYKTNTTNSIEVQLAVSENANAFTTFAATETSNVNGWSVASIDLSSLAGKTVSVIALNFKSAAAVAAYEATLGQLAVYPAGYSPVAPAISNVMAQAPLKEEISDIRLVWDADLTADFDHFNVYFTRKGVKALVGQTRQLAFYIPKFTRDGESEKSLSVSVAAVTKDMVESAETELTLDFPALLAPVVTVKAAKTLVKVNEEVVVEAQATNYPESYEWTAPANAVLVGTEGNKATFKFTAEGMYDLKVKVTNATGATEETSVGIIEVSETKEPVLVSVGADIVSDSGHFGAEAPSNLVDGVQVPGSVSAKWCFGGLQMHNVVIDLKDVFQIYRFQWFDCGHKENHDDNAKNFKVELSIDGENWTEVLDEQNRPEDTKNDYIKGTVGRFVRFSPYDLENDITIRIWEFEVYGIAGPMTMTQPEDVVVNIGEKQTVTVPYTLGEAKAANFDVAVTAQPEGLVTIENVAVADENVTFDVVAGNLKAKGSVNVVITNGVWAKSCAVPFSVTDPNSMNVVAGLIPTLELDANDYDEPNNDANTAGAVGAKGITDGNQATWWTAPYFTNKESHNILTFDLGDLYNITSFKFDFTEGGYFKIPAKVEIYVSSTTDEEASYTMVKEFEKDEILAIESEVEGAAMKGIEVDIAAMKKTAKFIKLSMTTQTYYNFRFSELEVLGSKYVVEPIMAPVAITAGLNADVIAESKPSIASTSAALDDQGWVMFTSAVKEEGSICTETGIVTTTEGTNFQIAAFDANNAAQIRQANSSATLEFAPIAQATEAHVLAICANGSTTMEIVVNYTDDTSSEPTSVALGDWYQGSSAGTAVYGLDRIIRSAADGYTTDQFDGRLNFCLFEAVAPVNPLKTVKSITCKNAGSGQPTVFGVTMKYTPAEGGDGINNNTLNGVVVYPNPVANGEVLHVEAVEGATVQFVSLQGVVLMEQTATDNGATLSVNGMSAGTYLLVVKDQTTTTTSKVIVK